MPSDHSDVENRCPWFREPAYKYRRALNSRSRYPPVKPSGYMGQDVSSTHSTPTLKTTEEDSTLPPANMSKEATVEEKRTLFRSCMIVAACTLAMIVNVANATSASISVPTISKELHVSPIDIVWIVSAYPLSSGCLLLLFGRLADLYGRKTTFSLGNLWLVGFTLGCAFANNATTLSILRGFQGVGAAATIPASLGILAHHFPPSHARSIAFATFAAGAPVGGSFGTTLGGALVQLTEKTWRSPFYLNTSLAFLSFLIGFLFIEQDRPSEELDRRVDWIGALLATAGLTLIIFVLGQGEVAPKQWSTGYIIGLMITGVILLVLFVLWQHHLEKARDGGSSPDSILKRLPTPPPLMKLSLWTRANGRVAVVMCIAFLNWCCFLSWSYWTTLYYQEYLGLSPVLTMVRLVPMTITGITCNVVVALFVGRLPFVILMAIGTGLTSSAALLFALINPKTTYWAFGFPAAIVSVVGADFVFAAGTLFIAKVSLPHEQSVAGGVFQCMTQLGTSLGITISTVVSNRVAAIEVDQLERYKAAQWTNLGFGILAVSLSIIWLRGVGPIGHNSKTAPPEDVEQAKDVNSTEKEQPGKDKKLNESVDVEVRDASKRAPEESSL